MIRAYVPPVLLVFAAPPAAAPPEGPAVEVTFRYPGVTPVVVEQTVITPVEKQLAGVKGLKLIRSRCADGGGTVVAYFDAASLPFAPRRVQERVNLAVPTLPLEVQRQGISVTLTDRGALPVVGLALTSPDGKYDTRFLGNYARLRVEPELARLPGLGSVRVEGGSTYGLRIWLDPDRLAARDLTASDVIAALRRQAPKVDGAKDDKPVLPREGDPDAWHGVVLKQVEGGQVVYLRDVARVEMGSAGPDEVCLFDGKPAVCVGAVAHAGVNPARVAPGIRDLAKQLRENLPVGMELTVAFDFAAADARIGPRSLLVEVTGPDGISSERLDAVIEKTDKLLRGLPAVAGTLAWRGAGPTGHVLVGLKAIDVAAVRKALGQIEDARCRVLDLSGQALPRRQLYPVRLDLTGEDAEELSRWAGRLAEDLAKGGTVTDVDSGVRRPTPQLHFDVDKPKADKMGVELQTVFDQVRAAMDGAPVGEVVFAGRRIEVRAQVARPAAGLAALREMKVRSADGKLVPLGTIVAVNEQAVPAVLERRDGRRCVTLTANPAAGVTAADATARCRDAAEKARKDLKLADGYRVEPD